MSDILQYFRLEQDFETGKTTYYCLSCPVKYTHKNVTKMKKHVHIKCPRLKELPGSSTSAIDIEKISETNTSQIDKVDFGNHSYLSNEPVAKRKKISNSKLIVKTAAVDKNEQEILSEKLAFAIFTSKCPFSLVENDAWLEFFQYIKPSFKVPSRKVLSDDLLQRAYTSMKRKVHDTIYETDYYLSLQVDGLMDLIQKSVLNFIINTPRPVFVGVVEVEAEHHTVDNISKKMKKVMKKYSSEPDKFAGFITNDTTNMIGAAEKLLDEYPALIFTTCFSNCLNLFLRDILNLQSIADIINNVFFISKAVKESTLIKAKLVEICKEKKIAVKLMLPCRTRWKSLVRCFENFISLKKCLEVLVVDCEEVDKVDQPREKINMPKMFNILFDENFWNKLENILNLIKSILNVAMKIQTNEPNIHTIYFLFSEVEATFSEYILGSFLSREEREIVLEKFSLFKMQFVKPLFWTAYQLNPNYDRKYLHADQEGDVLQFIDDLCGKLNMTDDETGYVLADFINYKSREGLFSKSYLWKICNKVQPIQWWQNVPCKLSAIAIRILSVPATMAATERSFSYISDVQMMKRNHLTFEHLKRLTYVAFNNSLLTTKKTLYNKESLANFSGQQNNDRLTTISKSGTFCEYSGILHFYEEENSNESHGDYSIHNSDFLDVPENPGDIEYVDIKDLC